MATAAQLVSLRRAAGYNLLATAGVVMVAIFLLCALFAPWIAPQDPARIDLPARLLGPSASHWFGTDELGRDILSRVIYGARISMLVGSCVVAASLTLGLIFGSIAGYYGGVTDRVLNVVVMNAFMSFPGILLAIAFVAFLGPGIFNLILALSIGGWVGYARLVRAQVLAVREREFVEAARALGASDLRIIVRHILPEHYSAHHRASGDRNGGRDPGRSYHELPWAGRAASGSKLGFDAERRALPPVRFAPSGAVPGGCSHAGSAIVQFYWGRIAGLSRPTVANRGWPVGACGIRLSS